MIINTSTTLTSAEWTGILYDLILFECSGKYASNNNECPVDDIANALTSSWRFQENNASRFNCPYDNFMNRRIMQSSDSIKNYINSLRSHTFSIFPRQLTVGTRYIFSRIDNDKQVVQKQDILSLPSLSDTASNVFLDRYAALVPSYYHDDFAALIQYVRNNWWTHGGSGGSTCMLPNGLKGVAKLSKKHNDKKRLNITQFSPRELERLRELARQREADANTRQQQTNSDTQIQEIDAIIRQRLGLTQLEAQKKEQDQIQQQDNIRTLQEQLRAMQLQGVSHSQVDFQQQPLETKHPENRGQMIGIITNVMTALQTSQIPTSDRINSVQILHRVLQENLRRYTGRGTVTVHLLGSFESGLSSMDSDADFTVYDFSSHSGGNSITELAKALQWAGCEAVTTIATAQVPIASFTARDIQCDISMDQPMGVINSKLISTYRKIDNRFATLWFSVRQIAKKNGILSGITGYLSSYALTMMVIVFLQNVTSPPILPALQQRERRHMVSCKVNGHDCSFDRSWGNFQTFTNRNTKTAGELLIEFCWFYGYSFEYAVEEVNPRLGVIKPRSFNPPPPCGKNDKRLKDWPICIMDPFILDRNVAGNCRSDNVAMIQKCFQKTFDALDAGDVDRAFKN